MKGVKLIADFTSDARFGTKFQTEQPDKEEVSVNIYYTTSLCNCTWASKQRCEVLSKEQFDPTERHRRKRYWLLFSVICLVLHLLLHSCFLFGRYQNRNSAWRPAILTEVSRGLPRWLQMHNQYCSSHILPTALFTFILPLHAVQPKLLIIQ